MLNLLTILTLAPALVLWVASYWAPFSGARRGDGGPVAWFFESAAGTVRVARQVAEGVPALVPAAITYRYQHTEPGRVNVLLPQGWRFDDAYVPVRPQSPVFIPMARLKFRPQTMGLLGFGWEDATGHSEMTRSKLTVRLQSLTVPYWALAVLAATPRLMLLARDRRRTGRLRRGRCLRCGYDLRASQDKCPECGMVISQEGRR